MKTGSLNVSGELIFTRLHSNSSRLFQRDVLLARCWRTIGEKMKMCW